MLGKNIWGMPCRRVYSLYLNVLQDQQIDNYIYTLFDRFKMEDELTDDQFKLIIKFWYQLIQFCRCNDIHLLLTNDVTYGGLSVKDIMNNSIFTQNFKPDIEQYKKFLLDNEIQCLIVYKIDINPYTKKPYIRHCPSKFKINKQQNILRFNEMNKQILQLDNGEI